MILLITKEEDFHDIVMEIDHDETNTSLEQESDTELPLLTLYI